MYTGKELAKGILRTRKGLAIELEALCKEVGCSYEVMQRCIPVVKSAGIPIYWMHRVESPNTDFPVIMSEDVDTMFRYMVSEMTYLPGTFVSAIVQFMAYITVWGIDRLFKLYEAPELIVKEKLGDNASWEDMQRVMREIEEEKRELESKI